MLFADGCDEAVIGIAYRADGMRVVLYDERKCIEALIEQGLSQDEAQEHFSLNVSGAYVGPDTPCFALLDARAPFEEV